VPKDLKPSGKTETFTVTVKYETMALYGKVEASRKVVVVVSEK
jgi:hypothetical protein